MALITFPIQLLSSENLTSSVRHLVFRRTDGKDFHFIPGQFFNIYFDHEGKTLNRSYSIATIPENTTNIEVAISYVEGGPASALLFNLQPGDQLTAAGPFGRLILPPELPKRYIFMATGTGITPYRAMLTPLKTALSTISLEVTILFGIRTREDLIYAKDFLTMATLYPRFKFEVYYSREKALVAPHPWEHQGHIQNGLMTLNPDPTRDLVYLCGNPNMIDETFSQLQALNFSTHQIKREKYFSRKSENKEN